jgi:hypothetical protein
MSNPETDFDASRDMYDRKQQRHERNEEIFLARLCKALNAARNDNVAIVIVPPMYPKHHAVALLAQYVNHDKEKVQVDAAALHFTGTRGSVRVYPSDHITYCTREKRLWDYPPAIPTFLHPDVEGL